MLRKYIIVLCCITVICIVLGHTANISYDDFVTIGDYLTAEDSYITSEVELLSKVSAWFSMYSVDYDIDLHVLDHPSEVDYIFLPPEEDTGYPGVLVLIIDSTDSSMGIDGDLRRIANMLVHDAVPQLPEDPDLSDIFKVIGSTVQSVFVSIKFFIGIVYSLIVLLLHALPLVLELVRAFLYLLGFTNSLA